MEKMSKEQSYLLLSYLAILLVGILLGLILSGGGRRGIGFIIGMNLAITIIGFHWLWHGESYWEANKPK
jgi:hypothetical protein